MPTSCCRRFVMLKRRGVSSILKGRYKRLHPGKDIPEGRYIAMRRSLTALAERIGTPSWDRYFVHYRHWKNKRFSSWEFDIQQTPARDRKLTQGTLRATFAPVLFDRGVRMKHNAHLSQSAKDPRIQDASQKRCQRNLRMEKEIRVSQMG